jgi:AcrR family transcriptional regulator
MPTQAERSSATRERIVAAAEQLFATKGWPSTSVEEIAQRAGVTKGALYHHFEDKLALMRAAYEHQEEMMAETLVAKSAGQPDPLAMLRAGCHAFFDACRDPAFRRIALVEAPAALGWEEWRAIDARHGFGLLRVGVETAVAAGQLRPLPVDQLAHLLLAAMMETALLLGQSTDTERTADDLAATFDALLDGLATQ